MNSEAAAATDEIFTNLGTGWWTLLMFLGTGISIMTEVIHLVGSEFMAPTTLFTCADPLYDDVIPINGTECFVEKEATNESVAVTLPCQRFSYDHTPNELTITMEFDLVCSRSWLQPFYQIIFSLGLIIGSVLTAILPDMFGRQRCLWYCVLGLVAATILQVTVPNITVVFISRFLLGVFSTLSMTSGFTLGMEVAPPSLRTAYGILAALPYAMMMIIMSGVAYYVRQWRKILLICSVPLFFQTLLVNPIVMPESPRWLISRGRLSEAEQVFRRAAKLNNSEHRLDPHLQDLLKEIYEHESRAASSDNESSVLKRMLSLVESGAMRKLSLLLAFIWFTINVLYICVPLAADGLSSPYLYMALLGVAEVPAYTLTAPITSRFGRRRVFSICLVLIAVLLALSVLLFLLGIKDEWVKMVLAAVPYTLICSCYQLNMMFTAELYPTSVRTMGTSTSFFFGNIGLNVPPLFTALISSSLSWLPAAIYSCLALVTSVLVLMLPETNNVPLLQTVNEYIMAREQEKTYKSKRAGKSSNQLDDKTIAVDAITGREVELGPNEYHNEGFDEITDDTEFTFGDDKIAGILSMDY